MAEPDDGLADVLIVGAGAAGLAAAAGLSARGKTVTLLEGRPRIGGRIDTLHDPAWPLAIERGAEFIHGLPKESLDILHASGCVSYDIADSHHLFSRGRLKKQDDFFEQVERILALTAKPRGDMSFHDCMQRFAGCFSRAHRNWARSYVEGFDAADARLVSSHWLRDAQRAADKIDGDRLARIYAGYDRLTSFLRTGIPNPRHKIELNTTATHIRWGKGGEAASEFAAVTAVRAGAAPVIFKARQVLVTVPVSLLQLSTGAAGHITFEPPLPPAKIAAIQHLRCGPVVKVLLLAKDAFWEKAIPDLGFFHAPGTAFPTWWTSLPIRSTVLTGWAGGPAAGALAGKPIAEILRQALAELATLLRVPARKIRSQIIAAHVCDWQSEPLSRGAYSYALTGGSAAARELARPLPPRLFFAGEATHSGLAGTVPAALASAHRAVREILRET